MNFNIACNDELGSEISPDSTHIYQEPNLAELHAGHLPLCYLLQSSQRLVHVHRLSLHFREEKMEQRGLHGLPTVMQLIGDL
jgi:hypothetical protein